MKHSTRIQNEELERLVSLPEKAFAAGSGEKRLQTLSKGCICLYFTLLMWENSKADFLPEKFLDAGAPDPFAMKNVNLIYFYPDDVCGKAGISDDSLRRCLEQLALYKFIHLFSPVYDENNYIIYRVGIDAVQDPSSPQGKKGYTVIDRDFFEEILKIKNVGVLRIVIRMYQENARHNDGRDSFENMPVRSMLHGLPGYTVRPAFLSKVSAFFKNRLARAGEDGRPSGIFFDLKKKKRFDIQMAGGYSWQRRKEESDKNLQDMKNGAKKLGCLAAILSEIADPSGKDPGRVSTQLNTARKLYNDSFGRELSDDALRKNYSTVNPYAAGTFSAFRSAFDPSMERVRDPDFRTVVREYGASKCLDALKHIWKDMIRGTLQNLSGGRTNFGALVRAYIQNDWKVPKETFKKELKIFHCEERTFTPIPLPSLAN